MRQLISDICKIGPSITSSKRQLYCKVCNECPKGDGYDIAEFNEHCFNPAALDSSRCLHGKPAYDGPLTEQEAIDRFVKNICEYMNEGIEDEGENHREAFKYTYDNIIDILNNCNRGCIPEFHIDINDIECSDDYLYMQVIFNQSGHLGELRFQAAHFLIK